MNRVNATRSPPWSLRADDRSSGMRTEHMITAPRHATKRTERLAVMANVRAQAGRAERVRHGTEAESRPCLQRAR
jgi:hypothetical protein